MFSSSDGEIYDYVESLMDDSDMMNCCADLLSYELLGEEGIDGCSIETGEVDEYDEYFELRILDDDIDHIYMNYMNYTLNKRDIYLDETAYKMKKCNEVLNRINKVKKHVSLEIKTLQQTEQTIETIEHILKNKYSI